MEARDLTLLGGAVIVLLVAVVVLVVLLTRARRLAAAERAAARGEAARLSARLEELSLRLEDLTQAASTPAPGPGAELLPAEFVITRAGEPEPDVAVADRLVLSATVGEPLIRVAAFAHGVRRALAPETRNRIFFEMRREVRRSRKQRRRDVREALRRVQADQRAQDAA